MSLEVSLRLMKMSNEAAPECEPEDEPEDEPAPDHDHEFEADSECALALPYLHIYTQGGPPATYIF